MLPALEDFVRIDSQALQWRPDAPFELDVAVFERLLAQAGQSAAGQAALEQAVARYSGDLLPRASGSPAVGDSHQTSSQTLTSPGM